MADNPIENNTGPQSVERKIEQKVAAQSAEQLKEEFHRLEERVETAKNAILISLRQKGETQYEFHGDKDDEDSPRGKAHSVTEFVQKLLFAAKVVPGKVPSTERPVQIDPQTPQPTPESTKLIQKLSERILLDDVTNQNAPYLFSLLKSITEGEVKSPQELAQEIQKAGMVLRYISPGIFDKLQKAGVAYAIENNIAEKDAKHMFGVENIDSSGGGTNRDREVHNDQVFEQNWSMFSSYFNDSEDKKLIRTLYSPEKFIEYYDEVKGELVKREESLVKGKDVSSVEVAEEASKEMEIRISLLFAKLYAKLDHEKPNKFFQEIEQEDMLRGIVPVKSELKRRIQRLAQDLNDYEKDPKNKSNGRTDFYRRLEPESETAAIDVGKGKLKPRTRLKLALKPERSTGSEFAHYLDQVIEHYIQARSYTHNSRAVFLHPPGKEGFYRQLEQFAAGTTTLDFDQMMLLPDNEIFQSAFGLYNKMIEEGFAKNDWRHSTTMFTQSQNENLTPIEKRVLKQLGTMYNGVSEERLAAALTMAVGAARGMFLTEVEMAAFADPHLDEKGNATFASYYNQDASALLAFNPMHVLYRFHGGPNKLDPIFFLPISEIKGGQAFNNHSALWEKAKLYKESFLKGRRGFHGEKTFADMLVNIGLVGGTMQRKGWRTTWQLESLYINDTEPNGAQKTNHLKTFKYFENIGYEILQDYVTKLDQLDPKFASARDKSGLTEGEKKTVAQKKELFEYIFKKYFDFDKDPKDLNKYLDDIRSAERNKAIDAIRKGTIGPSDIDAYVETATSKVFLDRALTRVILQRIPSKILRMDRDRLSLDGTSRWRQIMKDMEMDGQFDAFDNIMQDVILAEQLLRKEVSGEMNKMRESNKPGEEYASIPYRLSAEKITTLLKDKKDMTPERINIAVKLYKKIQDQYFNDDYINKELVPYFKNGAARDRESKFTIALDETDLSFIPFRGGGQSILKRAIGDIATVEEKISQPLTEIVAKIREMAINGKSDFGPVIEIIQGTYAALDGVIGTDYAQEVASKLASLVIMYMKKDTRARAFYGVFGIGRYNSMAAESAGRKVGVWEWDSSQIDSFILALESRGILPTRPYNFTKAAEYEARYVNVPLVKKPVKLPEKIELSKLLGISPDKKTIKFFGKEFEVKKLFPDVPLFRRRKRDYTVWSKQLRENFGGTKADMFFDIINKYLPAFLIFILFAQLKKAFEELEGKKKQ